MTSKTDDSTFKEIERELKCPNLRSILLDDNEFNKDDVKTYIVDHSYRLIMVTFYLFYSIYLQEKKDGDKTNYLNDRVRKHFAKLFTSSRVTLDLVFFILTELQIESSSNNNYKLKYLIDNSFNLSYWKEIFKYQILNDRELKTMSEMVEAFEESLQALPWVSITTISDTKNIEFYLKKSTKINIAIPSFGTIKFNEDQDRFSILDAINFNLDYQAATYKILETTPSYIVDIPIKADDQLNEVLELNYGIKHIDKSDSLLISKLYGTHLDKIRLLALAISDIVSENDLLKYNIEEKYAELDVFNGGIYNSSVESMSLDNIVTVLMIENGPSWVLDLVLDDKELNYHRILNILALRMECPTEGEGFSEKYHNERKKLLKRFSLDKFTQSSRRQEWINKHRKELMIQSIIKFVSREEDEYHHLVESLQMRENHFKELYKSKKSIDVKLKESNYMFERLFAFLNIFYSGLIGYALAEVEFENNHPNISNNPKEFAKEKHQYCENAFEISAKEWINKYNKNGKSLGSLMSHFQQLMMSTFSIKAHKLNLQQSGKALEKVIGRYWIGDIEVFNKLLSGETANIQQIVNDFKHFYTNVIDKEDLYSGFEKGFQIFEYLQYNKIGRETNLARNEISFSPIYPLVVEFSMQKKIRDGYEVNSYNIKGLEDGIEGIKILSSKEHEENQYYYCIPNITSSSEYWWIDPFFIKCNKVDGILNLLRGNEFGEGGL